MTILHSGVSGIVPIYNSSKYISDFLQTLSSAILFFNNNLNLGTELIIVDNGTNDEIKLDEPVKVLEGGTGFMMITRHAFENFDKHYPEMSYIPDHIRTKSFDGSREIMAYFDALIDTESKRYLSEDYMFCQWMTKVGTPTWICPWMKLQHCGSYVFGGSLIDIAQLGASATADPDMIKHMKKN